MGCPRRGGEHTVRGCRFVFPAGGGPRPASIAAFKPQPGTSVSDQATDDANETWDDWMKFVHSGPAPLLDSAVACVVQGLAITGLWTKCTGSKRALACWSPAFLCGEGDFCACGWECRRVERRGVEGKIECGALETVCTARSCAEGLVAGIGAGEESSVAGESATCCGFVARSALHIALLGCASAAVLLSNKHRSARQCTPCSRRPAVDRRVLHGSKVPTHPPRLCFCLVCVMVLVLRAAYFDVHVFVSGAPHGGRFGVHRVQSSSSRCGMWLCIRDNNGGWASWNGDVPIWLFLPFLPHGIAAYTSLCLKRLRH